MKIPVLYVGTQRGDEVLKLPDLQLVDEPSGTTKVFDPQKHIIVGVTERAQQRGLKIPTECVE